MTLSLPTFLLDLFEFMLSSIIGLILGGVKLFIGSVSKTTSTAMGNTMLTFNHYGVWALPLMVIMLGVTGLGAFFLLDLLGAVNDLIG